MANRSRLLGRTFVGLVLVVVVASAVVGPFRLLPGLHDASSLPNRMNVCGRDWAKDQGDRRWTMAVMKAGSEAAPVTVDPGLLGLFTACPAGACTNVALPTSCDTVIFVRVDEDAYVSYSLQGGP